MCSPAMAGAGGVAGGTALNAWGQAQALNAMRDVWAGQNQAQAGYDARLKARTDELINGISPQGVVGTDVAEATTNQLGSQARMTANAVTKAGKRKTGGASAGAEAQARTVQGNQGTLAQAIQSARLAGILRGLQAGQTNQQLATRAYGQDAGIIRSDAQRWENLAPMQEQAAGMTGGWARMVGQGMNTLGQGAMMYGMAQPRTAETAFV